MSLNFKKIFMIAIPIIGLLFGLKIYFKLDDKKFFIAYLIVGALVLIGSVLINMIYNVRFIKKMKKINELLENQDTIDKYVIEMEKIEKKVTGPVYRNMIILNLSYGYLEQEEYEKSLSLLKNIDMVKLKGRSRVIFALNKSTTYFYLGLYDEFISFIKEFEKELHILSTIDEFEWQGKLLEIYYQIAIKNYKKAGRMLKVAEKKWAEDKMSREWKRVRSVLNDKLEDGDIEREENENEDEQEMTED